MASEEYREDLEGPEVLDKMLITLFEAFVRYSDLTEIVSREDNIANFRTAIKDRIDMDVLKSANI